MLLHDLIPLIQLSVSPVIVISAVGLVLLSMTNRYGRVIDKARHLLDKASHAAPDGKAHVHSQIRIIYARCRSLRLAIFLASLSLLLMAMLMCLLFLFNLMHIELALLLVVLFIASMMCLSGSLLSFLVDINGSLHALTIEVRQHLGKT